MRVAAIFTIAAALFAARAALCAQDALLSEEFGQPATPRIVANVQLLLKHGDLTSAEALVAQYRRLYGDTPEAMDALSWLARGELAASHLSRTWQDAGQVIRAAKIAVSTRKLDKEPYLPLALGAAYEIQAAVLVHRHEGARALTLLESALHTWHGTSIEDRLQQGINLLTLEGRPAPLLRMPDWIGRRPSPQTAWRGRVVLLYFWADWCSDCKADAPVIKNIAERFEPQGLIVIAPTRLYGYTAQDEHAPPAEEKAFIERVFAKFYATIPRVQVPLDTANFRRFGASTTPTIVLIDRRGIVRLYHPGVMSEEELRQALEPLLVRDNP